MKKYLFLVLLSGICHQAIHAVPPPSTQQPVKSGKGITAVSESAWTITGNGLEQAIDAGGKDVLITGSNNKVTITGDCKKLVITGSDNEVDVAAVMEIVVTGKYNFVGWQSSGQASGKPKTSDTGGYNNIGKRSGNALDKSEN